MRYPRQASTAGRPRSRVDTCAVVDAPLRRDGRPGGWFALLLAGCLAIGCQSQRANFDRGPGAPPILSPPVSSSLTPEWTHPPTVESPAPRSLRRPTPGEPWNLTLDQAIQFALAHSQVMADSGGRVLAAPALASTVYDPALRETDPIGGPIAALTAFDASFSTTTFWRSGNNFFNNSLLGGGANFIDTTQVLNDTAITKKTATGATLRLDSNTEFLASNAPFNYYNSLTSTSIGGEFRQPLLRGAGTEYNRIAGAFGIPGGFNGVVIGRINTDISLIDFESAVRAVVLDVERAYWDLSLSYRDLEAKVAARDATLETWRLIHRKLQVGMFGADEEAEARVREQYFVLQAQVENAYSGAPPVSAALGNTIGNAIVGNTAGVLGNERRLRQLMGLPPGDHRIIRPVTEPTKAPISFDWDASIRDALSRRAELRKQALTLKRREAEWVATRNFRYPQLDLVGTGAYRAFDRDLSRVVPPPLGTHVDNANYAAGLVFSTPLGNRFANTAIRNAELQLARERALLREQEHHVIHELAAAMVELDRAYTVMNTTFNRRAAAEQQLSAVTRKYEVGVVGLDPVLDAQRRWADAEASYHRAIIDYNRAITDTHVSRGTLLEYDGVRLAEAPSWREEGAFQIRQVHLPREMTIDYVFSPHRNQPITRELPNGVAHDILQREAEASLPPSNFNKPDVPAPLLLQTPPQAPPSREAAILRELTPLGSLPLERLPATQRVPLEPVPLIGSREALDVPRVEGNRMR